MKTIEAVRNSHRPHNIALGDALSGVMARPTGILASYPHRPNSQHRSFKFVSTSQRCQHLKIPEKMPFLHENHLFASRK
jgi:hypothetical protein